jgi:hypothetical protein
MEVPTMTATETEPVSTEETTEHRATRLAMKARLKLLATTNRDLRLRTKKCNDGSLESWRVWHDRLARRRETTGLLIAYHLHRGTGKEGSHQKAA